ncbi:MAG: hypothetical protein ACI30I_02505 [Parabacteroides sp.]
MKKEFVTMCLWLAGLTGFGTVHAEVDHTLVKATLEELAQKHGASTVEMEKGVNQVADLWTPSDGNPDAFKQFCLENYIADAAEREQIFQKISFYLENLRGNYNDMDLALKHHVSENIGEVQAIDELFSAYDPSTHFSEDLYANKIAFVIALNFPYLTLQEKEALGNDRLAWAYARLGDLFTRRIPAEVKQESARVAGDIDLYVANYNIFMAHLRDKENKQLFPDGLRLLCHWNLRDEIKSNYPKGKTGLQKQRMIYEVMKRVIAQEIPTEVINSDAYEWNPYDNTLWKDGKPVDCIPEETTRYQKMLDNFHVQQMVDKYAKNTYIDRHFNESMEISVEDAEQLFDAYLSAPELKQVGQVVSKRLGRKLEPFDIWYDGFKSRSNLDEDKLSEMTRQLYPNATVLEEKLPEILQKLGFPAERAAYLASKVDVKNARGSGFAWPAAMKGQKSHLFTRIGADGMDYKGYNIAIHEFGHNIEETISLYDVDYYTMSGVPNNAFTEALAFLFQCRDLKLLGIEEQQEEAEKMKVLDNVWSLYEICGVSMLDISVWKWMYAHPDANAAELKEAVMHLSKEIWNRYYAPVYGVKDATVLAIYSHMISYPLYLSSYAFGQIIHHQIEDYLSGKDFASEVSRIFRQGRLTPNAWIHGATGKDLTPQPLLEAVHRVLK